LGIYHIAIVIVIIILTIGFIFFKIRIQNKKDEKIQFISNAKKLEIIPAEQNHQERNEIEPQTTYDDTEIIVEKIKIQPITKNPQPKKQEETNNDTELNFENIKIQENVGKWGYQLTDSKEWSEHKKMCRKNYDVLVQ